MGKRKYPPNFVNHVASFSLYCITLQRKKIKKSEATEANQFISPTGIFQVITIFARYKRRIPIRSIYKGNPANKANMRNIFDCGMETSFLGMKEMKMFIKQTIHTKRFTIK